MFLRLVLPIAALALTAAVQPQRIDIQLSNFKFAPDTIKLVHGQPYVLHLENKAGGSHDFVAKTFFAAAAVAPGDKAKIANGSVELEGGDSADIHLTAPAAGSYEVHCSHFMHTTFGMTGKIVVS
ncbi:MAG: cupredoxin domain-containing protein [Sphingomonas sp.]